MIGLDADLIDDFGTWKTSQHLQGLLLLGHVVIGGQAVDGEDLVSVRSKPFHQMTSDETGSSGN